METQRYFSSEDECDRFQLDRGGKYLHVDSLIRDSLAVLESSGAPEISLIDTDSRGQDLEVIINMHFIFALYLIKQTLKHDIIDNGNEGADFLRELETLHNT